MKNIAVLSDFDISRRPRPYRLILALRQYYKIFAIAQECSKIDGISSFAFPALKTAKERSKEEEEILRKNCKNKEFKKLIYTQNRLIIKDFLSQINRKNELSLIIVEDLVLLPFAIDFAHICKEIKVMIDLREFYPLEYENDLLWSESFGAFFTYLCTEYLPKVDFAITVSEGIAQAYKLNFGIIAHIFHSLPPFFSLQPSNVDKTAIQIIYHGFISPDRHSENFLEIAQNLDERFFLNLMVLSNQKGYLEKIKHQARNIDNIKFLLPVEMNKIIPFCQQFDIGILSLVPNSFNNANALPNKFFEYIQSRLCLISSPLSEIKNFVRRHDLGRVAQNFEPKSIAKTLNALSEEEIFAYKNASNKIAHQFSLQSNVPKILRIITDLIG